MRMIAIAIFCLALANPTNGYAEVTTKPCLAESLRAASKLRENFGLKETQIKISANVVCQMKHRFPLPVDVVSATVAAMTSFISDAKDIESPLALATLLAFEELGIRETQPIPVDVRIRADEILKFHLNSPLTTFSIEPLDAVAEHGEVSGPLWIFKMTAKSFSDHIFWAIVDRRGVAPTYNYGFN